MPKKYQSPLGSSGCSSTGSHPLVPAASAKAESILAAKYNFDTLLGSSERGPSLKLQNSLGAKHPSMGSNLITEVA